MARPLGELPFSRSRIKRIGERLAAGAGDQEDELAFRELLVGFDDVLLNVAARLRSLGLQPTQRLKNRGTILDKVRRDRSELARIRDIAGCRLVLPSEATRLDQDALVRVIVDEFGPDCCRIIDRRADPSHGYRAVHVEVQVAAMAVEVQVRTHLQHRWAELMESLGDRFGRRLRYEDLSASRTTSEQLEQSLQLMMLQISALIDTIEVRRSEVADLGILVRILVRRLEAGAGTNPAHGDELTDLRGRLAAVQTSVVADERSVSEMLDALHQTLRPGQAHDEH